MSGHGLVRENGSRGDQFVELEIELPEGMSDGQLKELTAAIEAGEMTFPKSSTFDQAIKEGSS